MNFHGTRVGRKGLLSTFMCLEIFEKLFLDLVRCSTFTSLPRIDVCGWQNFWKLDTLLETVDVRSQFTILNVVDEKLVQVSQ